MKTKEFKRRLSMFAGTHGMRVNPYDDSNYVVLETDDSNKLEVLCVDTTQYFSVNSIEIAFDELPHLAKQEVMNDIIFPYISTPLEEREEEKKYRYKFKPSIKAGGGGKNKVFHLARYRGLLDLKLDASGISYAKSSSAFHFTDKQVEEFTDEQKMLIQLCEKIEVTP